jgi:hypothetical protein
MFIPNSLGNNLERTTGKLTEGRAIGITLTFHLTACRGTYPCYRYGQVGEQENPASSQYTMDIE